MRGLLLWYLMGACAGLTAQGVLRVDSLPYAWRAYDCTWTETPPIIDGRGDDPVWTGRSWSEAFVDIEGADRPRPRYETRFKMAWDSSGLYVLAQLEEPHLWATLHERESIIFHDNDFELFLDPSDDTHLYYELEINALGTEWDLLLVKPYRDGGPALHAWDIEGLQSAVYLQGTLNDPRDRDTAWWVELFLPWTSLREAAPGRQMPTSGAVWRLNFSRVQWDLDVHQGEYTKVLDPATGRPQPERNWVWSPPGRINMHEPERWGYLRFVRETPTAPYTPEPAAWLRWTLREVYYRQRAYHAEHGTYARRLAELDITQVHVKGLATLTQMTGNGLQYLVSIRGRGDGRTWYLDQSGRTWAGE